jgi:hypothetical protein
MTNTTEMTHGERMERRGYLLRKRGPQYHVTIIRRDMLNGREADNLICAARGNDLPALIALADAKAPAYVINDWARPTPKVVHVALAEEPSDDHYMKAY